MAISRNFNGATLFKPGVYTKTQVNLAGGFPLAPTGVVAIVGEAEGGEAGSSAGVLRFTSEDIASLVDLYKSGPIVDAARTLIAPSRDQRVVNGASQILVYKTNSSTQASRTLNNDASDNLITFTSKNYGEDENQISVKIEAGVDADARVITIKKGSTTEVLSENANEDILSIQYTGTEATATLTIQSGSLDVTAGADSISINLSGLTIDDLVDRIDSEDGYSASSSLSSSSFKQASDLDAISTVTDIKTSAVVLKAAQKEILDIIASESNLVDAEIIANVEGVPAVINRRFLNGGSKGASSNTSFQDGFDALLAVRANTIVPLVSRDASVLATEGKTDPASTFTVDSVNLQALTHCITASNTKNRSERNCYVSSKGTFAEAQQKSQTLANERASMLFQDVEILGSDGNIKTEEPWAAACIVAGMQAGSEVGEPTTFKIINVNGIEHSDYNSKTQIDLAISAGLTPLEEIDSGGFRVVVGNTTYGRDANFVLNRVSVLEAADNVAFNLRQQLESIFIGTKAATGTKVAIENTVKAIMTSFLDANIIVGDDTNDGLGFKNLIVKLEGNAALIEITITPVQGVDFILPTITLDDIRQSA